MKQEDIVTRQSSHGIKDAFRFKAVLTSRKKGDLDSPHYVDPATVPVMSSHMFCARSHLFSHFSAFGLKLSHVTTTNTASLVLCRPVYSHYTHQQSRGCHASHARSHPATYIIIHTLSSTTLLFTIILLQVRLFSGYLHSYTSSNTPAVTRRSRGHTIPLRSSAFTGILTFCPATV